MSTEKKSNDWRAELEAMKTICTILEPLDHDTRVRVLAAVLCMFDQSLAETVVSKWWRSA